MQVFYSNSSQETRKIAYDFAKKLKKGDIVAFFGGLGMGKTTFIRGLNEGLGIDSEVSSPTFSLVNEYRSDNISMFHFDMYRINGWDDLYSTGFFDYIAEGGILACEWSENIENALPDDCIKVIFSPGENENERNIEIIGVDLL